MATKQAPRPKRGSSAQHKPPSATWAKLLRNIPGYDPIATAGDAWFDPVIAERMLEFFPECLQHIEGDLFQQPFILEIWQQAIVANLFGWQRLDERGRQVRRYRELFLYVPRKNGKRLALDTPIPTPMGWTTMGDLQIGDMVISETGEPAQILYVSEIDDTEPCYRLDFDDGTHIVAGESHMWVAQSYVDRIHHKPGRIYTTGEMWKHRRPADGRAVFRIKRAEAFMLPERQLPIDPYTFGLWIGNGTGAKPEITVNRDDVDAVKACIPYPITNQRQQEGWSDQLHIPALRPLLKALGLYGDYHKKRLPSLYLRSSIPQRWALLQGLMDSDGCVSTSGQSIYGTILSALAEDVLDLLRSLGIKATMNTVYSDRYDVPNEPYYRILFTAFDDMPVSALPRKLKNRKKHTTKTFSDHVYVSAIEPVSPVETRCIAVDSPSHLYLAGRGMIPTHNTPLVAGLGLAVLFSDDEKGQQDYIGAGDKEQAGVLFRYAKGMVELEPELQNRCRIFGGNATAGQARSIVIQDEFSFLRIISGEDQTQHGGTTHLAVIDELHVQGSRNLYDVLRTSMASLNRKQPLFVQITTADFDRPSICNEQYGVACRVRDGLIKNPSFLPVIYEAPKQWKGKDLDYTDPKVYQNEALWAIANPNLGVSVSREYLRTEFAQVIDRPAYLPTVLRLHLNVRTKQASLWLNLQRWDASAGQPNPTALMGRECYGGLDLGSTSDLTSLCLVFPNEDGSYEVLWWNWVPEEALKKRERRGDTIYIEARQRGELLTTEGDETDYAVVRSQINEIADDYGIKDLGVDRKFQGAGISQDLIKDGLTITTVGMGFLSMAAPTEELERLINRGEFHHGGKVLARWAAGNIIVDRDPAGNLKPDKAKSADKIDPIVSAIIALNRAMARDREGESVYNTRGILVL